jgi:organic radical activating enzyme
MRVNEIFHAVQGEGPNVGTPTVFIRLSGCNLNCDFCDSKYHKNGKDMFIDEIINSLWDYHCKDITLTGGEPTLQEEGVNELMKSMRGCKFNLETNGVIKTNLPYDNIIVSPKKEKICLETLTAYNEVEMRPKTWFKFVYENANDKWWEDIIRKLNIPNDRVYIMPEGKSRKEQIEKMPEVIEYCLEKDYKFGARIHTLAYDNKRGV